VIIGTGCGGGVVINGGVVTGPNAIAGEWGHNPLPWPEVDERPGPACYCGKRGCLETFISGTGLAADYAASEARSPARADAATVVTRAVDGDPIARAALDRYTNRLARGLATVVNVLDPDAIVLGGGMSNVSELYHTVPTLLPRFVFSDRVDTALLPPKHGDSSGVRGAAWLWSPEEAAVFATGTAMRR
jgi:fructokinase